MLEISPGTRRTGSRRWRPSLAKGMGKFNHIFGNRYRLLGLGMHPTARPAEIPVWDHDEGEYYEAYDRLFNIRQHGWLNIQALQINLSYENEKHLVASTTGSARSSRTLSRSRPPRRWWKGRLTGRCDNRLIYYRENQKEIPLICDRIVPGMIGRSPTTARCRSRYSASLRSRDAGLLCEEWVNSSGLIIRFSRKCLEIKALDEQESIRSDMGVCAFVRSLLRCSSLPVEQDHDALLALAEEAISRGTAAFRPELERLYTAAWAHATPDERACLPVIRDRIANGSLAERPLPGLAVAEGRGDCTLRIWQPPWQPTRPEGRRPFCPDGSSDKHH